MKWLARIFTWWHGQTLNTALHTLLFGKFVGKDEYGNRYYRTRKIDKALGFERRWVIYAGESDGSMTPQGWYGWLHHTFDVPPTQEEYAPRPWELPHHPNLTGTPQAWPPMRGLRRPAITRPGRRKAEVEPCPWLDEPASTRRTLGQATGGKALRLMQPTVATARPAD